MEYAEYQKRLKPGCVIGKGLRSYTVETVNVENTYLRGVLSARRQGAEIDRGSLRIIPTCVVMDIITAVEDGRLGIESITRNRARGESQSSSAFNRLGFDYDPYLMGYDSTIRSICEFITGDAPGFSANTRSHEPFLPKPFLLLAGISGTGKTRWVRMRKQEGVDNVKVIPVRPDWHEPSDLLGYTSRVSGSPVFVPTDFLGFLVEAWRHAWAVRASLDTDSESLEGMAIFWLCLDEMNLAPVEQYFADYLSVLEQRSWSGGTYWCGPLLRLDGEAEAVRTALKLEPDDPLWAAFLARGGLPLPPNLVVVGTVNMDETTHTFSRKVLDRALTLEFDEVDFSRFGGAAADEEDSSPVPWTRLAPVTDARDLDIPEDRAGEVLGLLEAWNRILDQTAFRIAYRTINESLLIAASLADRPLAEALDWIAMSKLLPRLEGDEDRLGRDREGEAGSFLDAVAADWSPRFGEAWEGSRARRKLDFMQIRLRRSGYSSYWP